MKKGILILFIALAGCASGAFYTAPEGTVIKVEGDLVCVVYDVLSEKGGQCINCALHLDGHGYKKGDAYPDFTKHKTGKSYEPRYN